MNQALLDVLFPALAAFAATALATPLVINLAKRFGLVDDPSRRPHPAHVHKRVIPRAGGLAIYAGIVITSLVFLPLNSYLLGIFAGITLLLVMGLADDKMIEFSPYVRLLLLFTAAMCAVGSGIGISFITNPFSGFPLLPTEWTGHIIQLDSIIVTLGDIRITLLADLFALLWIVALTQVINWSKGVDGQMPGITLMTALTLGMLSLKFYFLGDSSQLDIAKLAFIVAGASGAFLFFNWHPAKIFPGFSGSTILAYMLAVLAILSTAKVATALLVLAIPSIDFVYTFTRRILSGKSPVWGDRGHLHHRLLDNLHWSHQQISLFYMLGSAILGAAAIFISTESKVFVVLLLAIIFTGFILWLNSFGDLSKPQGPDNG